ncbi:unnamed protein product [Dibothriocephalus latus]|uniref:Cytosol aminopeptidase domain-containing protein n=1 Tax=Dibothriocephalus latus TaxID=60516 RepID=A0A3P7P0G4_DIBLA|nr:unnamed protein product [Dibothriocephalus latus]
MEVYGKHAYACQMPFWILITEQISTIRREDYDITDGQSEYEDLMQSYHKSDSEYGRGHQFPAAYLIRASGLDEHGINSPRPIPYTHVDICATRGKNTEPPTGVPVMALTVRYVLPRLGFKADN